MLKNWVAIFLGLISAPAGAASCTITSPTLNFGSYDPLSATALTSTAVVRVSCTRTVLPSETANYVLSSSKGNGASYAARTLLKGAEALTYNVYRNSARTQIWGDGTGGSNTISNSFNLNSGTTRNRNHRVYGRIPALQDISAGNYTDTLVTTLSF